MAAELSEATAEGETARPGRKDSKSQPRQPDVERK